MPSRASAVRSVQYFFRLSPAGTLSGLTHGGDGGASLPLPRAACRATEECSVRDTRGVKLLRERML